MVGHLVLPDSASHAAQRPDAVRRRLEWRAKLARSCGDIRFLPDRHRSAFALGPALKLSRSSVIGDLKEQAGEDVVRRRWRFLPRNPLVVAQIAFSLALLTAAALFIRGANKAAKFETGLHAQNNLLLEVDAGLSGLPQAQVQQTISCTER